MVTRAPYRFGWTLPLVMLLYGSACTAPVQRPAPEDMTIVRPGAKSLVVVHSRSGNTAAAGRVISEMMKADYLRLAIPEDAGNSLLTVPKRNDTVEMTPMKHDLSRYRLLFLGSPIWYWHPTAYIYTFIRNNDLRDRRVVLFYTYEGGLAGDAVQEWKDLVKQRGGEVIDVVGVDRSDLEDEEALRTQVLKMIDQKRGEWEKSRN
ncbi:MAG: hypothetical protein JXA20_19175 [Spirochaetes bacterium]|nr:hypothetical protein [Spirochaetota bacterium]